MGLRISGFGKDANWPFLEGRWRSPTLHNAAGVLGIDREMGKMPRPMARVPQRVIENPSSGEGLTMRRLLLMLSISLALPACDDHSTMAGIDHHGLTSRIWTLRSLNNRPVPVEADDITTRSTTFRFMPDRRIEGSTTCNRVFSPERSCNILGYDFHWNWPGSEYRWSVDPSGRSGRFEPALMAMTTAGCGRRSVDRIGEAFWKAMQHARRWSLHDRHLAIVFADGSNAILIPLSSQNSLAN